MSDSKGAAIDRELIQRVHRVVCAALGLDDESHEDDEEAAPLEEAILAILAQEVNKARIDELKEIQLEYGHYLAQTFISGEPQTIEERIKQLERLG